MKSNVLLHQQPYEFNVDQGKRQLGKWPDWVIRVESDFNHIKNKKKMRKTKGEVRNKLFYLLGNR